MFSTSSASITETGNVRQINEDAVVETGNLFAVADGMGGHQAGEVASNLALSIIQQYIEDNLGLISGEKLVEKAITAANATVHLRASTSSKFRDMGTTITLLYREGDTAYLGHVGDSRAYLFRRGGLSQLTRDHSLVAKLVEEGEITEEQARHHPQRNIILKALGLEPRVDVDVTSVKILPRDVFLLASDGLTGLVEDTSIAQVLAEETEPGAAARRLVAMALEAGGTDNVSVVIARFGESTTIVPVKGAAPAVTEEETRPGVDAVPLERKARNRSLRRWVIAITVILVVLGGALAAGYYFYNRTYYVGASKGKVALYHGFPFWGLASNEMTTTVELKYLPESLRRRVESNLETDSREGALNTIKSLEAEVEKNSVLVPAVEGMKFTEARDSLEKVGLRAESELVSRPNVSADTVINQDPVPGTRVGKGSGVKLQVVMPGQPGEV